MNWKPYTQTFKNSWQSVLEYRFENFLHFFTALIFLISIFYLWNNVFGDRAVLMGYTKSQLVTYYILIAYFSAAITANIGVRDDIADGSMSMYLTTPINYVLFTYFGSLARRIMRLLMGLPIIIIIFIIFHGQLEITTNPMAYLLMLLITFFAINILFLFDLVFNFFEFWITHSESLDNIINPIMTFFSGLLIPLTFLPLPIQTLADWLPFKYTGYFIIDAFTGRLPITAIFQGIAIQILWTIILITINTILWKKGLKRYEAFGN